MERSEYSGAPMTSECASDGTPDANFPGSSQGPVTHARIQNAKATMANESDTNNAGPRGDDQHHERPHEVRV